MCPRYLVGWGAKATGIIHLPRDFVGWEQRDMMSLGTIWMGMGIYHLLGYGLDGYVNCDLSRDRSHSPFPLKYRGKRTAGIFPRGALKIARLAIGGLSQCRFRCG